MSDPTFGDGFIVVGIIIAALVLISSSLFRPKTGSRTVYVPVEVEMRQEGIGCGPVFAIGFLLVVIVLAAIIKSLS